MCFNADILQTALLPLDPYRCLSGRDIEGFDYVAKHVEFAQNFGIPLLKKTVFITNTLLVPLTETGAVYHITTLAHSILIVIIVIVEHEQPSTTSFTVYGTCGAFREGKRWFMAGF
jgi:hypothetical protein